MENNNVFNYQYSAKQNKEVENIRSKYMPHQLSDIDTLRELDAKVKRPAAVFSYVFGSIGAIVMGCGMSLIMTDIASILGLGDMTLPGIAIGVVGLALVLVNYPIYKGILNSRKKKYAPKILDLSEKIMNN